MRKKHYLIIGIVLSVGIIFITGCGDKKETTNTSGAKLVNELSKAAQEQNENSSNLNSSIFGPTDGLAAYWPMDEGEGDYTRDLMNSYKGEFRGDVSFVEGKFGQALSFDGDGDYVNLSRATISGVGSQVRGTVAFWFKYSSLLDKQVIMPILYTGIDDTNKEDNMFIIEIGHFKEGRVAAQPDANNRKLYVTWIRDGDEPFLCFDSNTNLVEDTWYHFALVVGPEGNTGYLNGVELTDRHYNFGQSTDQKLFNDIPVQDVFAFGRGKSHDNVSPVFDYFKGVLDDVRIYYRALSPSEILELLE